MQKVLQVQRQQPSQDTVQMFHILQQLVRSLLLLDVDEALPVFSEALALCPARSWFVANRIPDWDRTPSIYVTHSKLLKHGREMDVQA